MAFLWLLLPAGLPAGSAAQEPPPEEAEAPESDLWNQVRRFYEEAKKRGEEVPGDVMEWVREDLRSVGDWEYRVSELASGPAETMQEQLNQLGADRWELVWVQPAGGETIRLIWKRPARSYLKHLSPGDLLRLLPSGGGSGG